MKRKLIAVFMLIATPYLLFGQEYEFKKLKNNPIKGAPILSAPKLLKTGDGEAIYVKKLGHVGPALYDWNKDGLKDLILGEFAYRNDAKCMVYENHGTNKNPNYSNKPYYALDSKEIPLYTTTS